MRFVLVFLALILFCTSAFAADYYINEEITVFRGGESYVEGSTNLDILGDLKHINEKIDGYTEELTSKKGRFWLFSYQSLDTLSDLKIKLILPENIEIDHISSSSKESLSIEDNHPVLDFVGQDVPLDIKVKYSFKYAKENKGFDFGKILIPLIIIIIVILFIFTRKKLKKKPVEKKDKVIDEEKLKTIKLTLNENQLKILEALINKGGEASQTQLKYLTDVPKSSLSRNLELMSQKHVISKYYSGTSNYIKIHPSLYKNQ